MKPVERGLWGEGCGERVLSCDGVGGEIMKSVELGL